VSHPYRTASEKPPDPQTWEEWARVAQQRVAELNRDVARLQKENVELAVIADRYRALLERSSETKP
jgi:hypothetical protein